MLFEVPFPAIWKKGGALYKILTENFQKQLIWGKISFLKLSRLNNSYQV